MCSASLLHWTWVCDHKHFQAQIDWCQQAQEWFERFVDTSETKLCLQRDEMRMPSLWLDGPGPKLGLWAPFSLSTITGLNCSCAEKSKARALVELLVDRHQSLLSNFAPLFQRSPTTTTPTRSSTRPKTWPTSTTTTTRKTWPERRRPKAASSRKSSSQKKFCGSGIPVARKIRGFSGKSRSSLRRPKSWPGSSCPSERSILPDPVSMPPTMVCIWPQLGQTLVHTLPYRPFLLCCTTLR